MHKSYRVNVLKSFFIWIVVFNFFTSTVFAELPMKLEGFASKTVNNTYHSVGIKLGNYIYSTNGVFDITDKKHPFYKEEGGIADGYLYNTCCSHKGIRGRYIDKNGIRFVYTAYHKYSRNGDTYKTIVYGRLLPDNNGGYKGIYPHELSYINISEEEYQKIGGHDNTFTEQIDMQIEVKDHIAYIGAGTHLLIYEEEIDEPYLGNYVNDINLSNYTEHIRRILRIENTLFLIGRKNILLLDISKKGKEKIIDTINYSSEEKFLTDFKVKNGYIAFTGISSKKLPVPYIFKFNTSTKKLKRVEQVTPELTSTFGDMKNYIFYTVSLSTAGYSTNPVLNDRYYLCIADMSNPKNPKNIMNFYEEKYPIIYDDNYVYHLERNDKNTTLSIYKINKLEMKSLQFKNSKNLVSLQDWEYKRFSEYFYTVYPVNISNINYYKRYYFHEKDNILYYSKLSNRELLDGGIYKNTLFATSISDNRLWESHLRDDDPHAYHSSMIALTSFYDISDKDNPKNVNSSFIPEITFFPKKVNGLRRISYLASLDYIDKNGYAYGFRKRFENNDLEPTERQITIYSLDDPTYPSVLSKYTLPKKFNSEDVSTLNTASDKIYVKNNYLFYLITKHLGISGIESYNELVIIDIKDKHNPKFISSIKYDKRFGSAVNTSLNQIGSNLYINSFYYNNYGEMIKTLIIDLKDIQSPKIINPNHSGRIVDINKKYLLSFQNNYFGSYTSVLYTLYDISNPLSFKEIKQVRTLHSSLYINHKIYQQNYFSGVENNKTRVNVFDFSKYFSTTPYISIPNENNLILYKDPSNNNVKFLELKSENFIENKTNWLVKIDGKEIDKSNKKEFTTSFDYSDYTLGEHTLEIYLLDENAQELDKKVITLNIKEMSLAYNIDRIVIADEYSNEYEPNSVPTNKPLAIVADTNISNIDDITFTWSIDGKVTKEGVGVDNSYLDYTFTKPETTILLTIEHGSEGSVSKELKVNTLLNTLVDLRAIGENRKLVVENGYFKEGMDRTGDYYSPTGNRLSIYDSKSNEIIANIKLTDPSAVKIYKNEIIGTDASAYITFTDDKLPLFEGKFIIEDEVLRNLLIAEALNEEKLNRVIDADKYCEGVTKYETLENNTKLRDCKELIDYTKLDRKLVKFLSDNIVPVTDATLLVGIDANAIGLSPSLLATPYLWDGRLDLTKKKFKLTALASPASMFNLEGVDFSLLDKAPMAVKNSLLSTAKNLGRIPFVYTLKSDGSATTEVGKSKLNIKALTLEFTDSKSLVLESKVTKTSDNDKHRENSATIKKAKAYLSLNKNKKKKATNIGFEINNAKLEERDGTYELVSYDGGANFSIPDIPLGKGRSLKNISGGIYFVGRSSVYDTDDWPVAFIDKKQGMKSKFYIYLKGHGEYVKELAPNKLDPKDPLGSMNSAWVSGDDYKNTFTVDFKVIPLPVANYDNGLLLSADIGYSTDGTSNIVNLKGFKLKELAGKYRYDTNLDDYLWKVTAGVEAIKYRGRGSLYWNWGENFALGGTIKDFGLSITNNKRFILGDGCILGGKLTPAFMELAECPKLTSACASNIGLSKNTLISNGFMLGMKAKPHYESRFSAAYPWENPFPYLEANAELGFKVIMDEKVKKGNSDRFQFTDPKLTANLAGSGSLSMKIPKSKSSYFPFPRKDITLVELCVGMSPFDVKRYYDEGLLVTTEKVDNIKGLFGFYGMSKIADKKAVVFYSFMPFKIKDVDEEQTWLYGTNFKIEVKDTVSKRKQAKYRKISTASNSIFRMNKAIEGEYAVETLEIPENNKGPLILIKNVNDVEITTPSGEVINSNNVENFDTVSIEKETNSTTIGLNNPNPGTWKFKFKNNSDYEFLVFSENIAPTVDATIDATSVEYGKALKLNLDYKDLDSPRGFIKVIATNSKGEEFILFDNSITVPYNNSIDLYIPKVGEYNLTLLSTDGLRAYNKVSLGSITITEPSKFIDNLKVTTGKGSVVSEWKSLNLVDGFDVTLFNKRTSVKNIYDKVSPNFSKNNLVDGDYTLKVAARYNGKIVDTLSKDFAISSEKRCKDMTDLTINEDFTDGYLLNFVAKNANYYLVDIQSFTDKFKHINRKQITDSIDLSPFVGEGIYITIEAINECGKTLSKSDQTMVSNQTDTDNDLLYDDWEIKYFGDLNQTSKDDFDSDGVNNLDEMKQYLNPDNGDTDGDKISDKDDAHPYINMDSNQNRIPDDWEVFYNVGDLSLDPDGDGVSSYDEYFLGTNPNVKDASLEDNNTTDNKVPVIQTDKDNFKTLTTSLSKNLIIDASKSFVSGSDSLSYSWFIDNKLVSNTSTLDYKFKVTGNHYLKLTITSENSNSTSKEWLVLVTKMPSDFKYIDIDKSDIEINYSGVKFTIFKSIGKGKVFTMDVALKDLPVKPLGYTFVGEKGKVLIFNGKYKLNEEMHIEHLSNKQLLRYSYTENKWYIVAFEVQSVNTKDIGLFALATKDKITNINTENVKSSGGSSLGVLGTLLTIFIIVVMGMRKEV